MNPIYDFTLKARWKINRNIKAMPDRTYSGEITITDSVDGDEQILPKVAVHLMTRICEKHQEVMTADSLSFNIKRRKPCKCD